MMLPPKVSRSTIAAQSRGSVKVFVQPEKASLDAIATEAFSSRSVNTWKSSSAPRRSSSIYSQLVDAEQVDSAVAGDGFGEHLLVGGLDEFGGQDIADAVADHRGLGAQCDEQVGFAGAGVADQAEWQAFLDPVAFGEGVNDGGVDVVVGEEVEGPQSFVAGERGGFDASFGAAPVAVIAFGHEQLGEEAAVGHLIAGGGLGQVGELGADRGQAQHPAGGVDRGVGGLFGQSSMAAGKMQVTCSPRRSIATSPKSTSASAPGWWVCGKNTLTGARPTSARIFGLRSAT